MTSKKMPSHEELIDVWRFAYARSSLLETVGYCKALLAVGDAVSEVIKKALLTSLVISYARPFTKAQVTKSKRITPLDSTLVPPPYQRLHNEYMAMRNCVFGHKDATVGPEFGPVNKVIVHATDKFMDIHTVSPFDVNKSTLQETISLCHELIEISAQHVERFVIAYLSKEHFPAAGLYEIDIEANSGNWLIPHH